MNYKRLITILLIFIVTAIFLLPELQKRPLYFLLRPFVYIVSTIQEGLTATANGMGAVWTGYIKLTDVRKENLELREQIIKLRNQNIQLLENQASVRRLESLLNLKEKSPYPLITSRVIARDPTNWIRSMVIDKGEKDGVAVDMGVIVPAGVVGRVMKTTLDTSYVLLLTDPRSAIAALIQQTRDEGIVVGSEKQKAKIKYIPILSDLKQEDLVLTSGLVGSFPKGLPIGRIHQVEKQEMALFQEAELIPEVDFHKLEEVMVIAMPKNPENESNLLTP